MPEAHTRAHTLVLGSNASASPSATSPPQCLCHVPVPMLVPVPVPGPHPKCLCHIPVPMPALVPVPGPCASAGYPPQCHIPIPMPVPAPVPGPHPSAMSQCQPTPVPSPSRQCGGHVPATQRHQHLHSSPCHPVGKQQGPCRTTTQAAHALMARGCWGQRRATNMQHGQSCAAARNMLL